MRKLLIIGRMGTKIHGNLRRIISKYDFYFLMNCGNCKSNRNNQSKMMQDIQEYINKLVLQKK